MLREPGANFLEGVKMGKTSPLTADRLELAVLSEFQLGGCFENQCLRRWENGSFGSDMMFTPQIIIQS